VLLLMMLIYVTILILLMLFSIFDTGPRPTGNQRGLCGWPGTRRHCIGGPCSRDYNDL